MLTIQINLLTTYTLKIIDKDEHQEQEDEDKEEEKEPEIDRDMGDLGDKEDKADVVDEKLREDDVTEHEKLEDNHAPAKGNQQSNQELVAVEQKDGITSFFDHSYEFLLIL